MFKNKSVIVTHLTLPCGLFAQISYLKAENYLNLFFKVLQNSWHHSGKPEVKITLKQKVVATSALIIHNDISTDNEEKSNFIAMYCTTQYFSIMSIHNILTR